MFPGVEFDQVNLELSYSEVKYLPSNNYAGVEDGVNDLSQLVSNLGRSDIR